MPWGLLPAFKRRQLEEAQGLRANAVEHRTTLNEGRGRAGLGVGRTNGEDAAEGAFATIEVDGQA